MVRVVLWFPTTEFPWIVSNFEYKNKQGRKEAIELLINTIADLAQELDNSFVYALIKNKPLINSYKKAGFVEASSYTTEMIKKF
jgi:hypothetical protein